MSDELDQLQDGLDEVATREDLALFISRLRKARKAGDWVNRDLDGYLEGLAAYVNDMDGAFKNRGEEFPHQPSWKMIADILFSAGLYE